MLGAFGSCRSLKRIVFWEPCVSPHKSGLFEALASLIPNIEIICIADSDLLAERKSLGWTAYEPVGYSLLISPSDDVCLDISTKYRDTTFHIFSGIRHYRCIVVGLRGVRMAASRFGVMSEPRVNEGLSGKLRFIQSWIYEKWIRENVSFVLAIGRNGPPWFRSVGYDTNKIFPFAYFVDKAPLAADVKIINSDSVKVGYLGRIIEMKGIKYFSDAILTSQPSKFIFHIVGDGDLREFLQEKMVDSPNPVLIEGAIPMSKVSDFLSQLDVLILPSISKDDGWGVVVSESLLVGTAVVATSCVGASILLDTPDLGRCINPKSSRAIQQAIHDISASGGFSAESRLLRRRWAERHLSSEAGALNLLDIINFSIGNNSVRPVPFYR